jgi:UDP-N-acetylglucosamine 2-epimerase (non-hydrolysing)
MIAGLETRTVDRPGQGSQRKILTVVGTRPNFMKMGPILRALDARPGEFRSTLVHTGQHYDAAMSDVFLEELGIGAPDHQLDVGSGSHAVQTARVMERLEPVLESERPDLMLVPGDVNSTLAAALVASKLGIPIGHVEAGLRSFDRTMPEEVNRILTDRLADLLFTHSPEAEDYLLSEGCDSTAIHYVGNTMIDTLVALRGRIDDEGAMQRHGLEPGGYALVTLHRPALVDGPLLETAMNELCALAHQLPVLFPAHPRTRAAIERLPAWRGAPGLRLVEPLGYLEFLNLLSGAKAALTDSGGIQEEATYLGVPCLTLRDNTERPVTVSMGTNVLLGLRPERIGELPSLVEEIGTRASRIPPMWDGAAAERIVEVLASVDQPTPA